MRIRRTLGQGSGRLNRGGEGAADALLSCYCVLLLAVVVLCLAGSCQLHLQWRWRWSRWCENENVTRPQGGRKGWPRDNCSSSNNNKNYCCVVSRAVPGIRLMLKSSHYCPPFLPLSLSLNNADELLGLRCGRIGDFCSRLSQHSFDCSMPPACAPRRAVRDGIIIIISNLNGKREREEGNFKLWP